MQPSICLKRNLIWAAVTCYSAYGMLSRLYLSMAGLTTSGVYDGTNAATDFNRGIRNEYYLNLAKQAALKVINESESRISKAIQRFVCSK